MQFGEGVRRCAETGWTVSEVQVDLASFSTPRRETAPKGRSATGDGSGSARVWPAAHFAGKSAGTPVTSARPDTVASGWSLTAASASRSSAGSLRFVFQWAPIAS